LGLLIILTLVGCGKDYDPDLGYRDINQDFSAYVQRFEQVSQEVGLPARADRLIMEFDESLSGTRTLGVCYYSRIPRVTINPSFWKSRYTSNAAREQLIFHELGHCVLGRGHTNEEALALDNGIRLPVSVMNMYHFNTSFYESNWNYYMQELFLREPPISLYASAPTAFPGSYYETVSTIYASKIELAEGEEFSEEMYQDISKFGCGHDH
jgi:hypothetical protein